MKKTILLYCLIFFLKGAIAQPPALKRDIFTHPPDDPVRTLAEWEELEAVALTYDIAFSPEKRDLIAEIALHAQKEVKVLVFCSGTSGNLLGVVKRQFEERGVVDQKNIEFIEKDFDKRIWIRDFGAHTVYQNQVGKRMMVDWEYESDYEDADILIPNETANFFGSDLYRTATDPFELKFDGGNIQADGLGTAITSSHVFDDNPGVSEETIDWISEQFMGIDNFIKLDKLPYDEIHHVDMHMKMLDEETLLVGHYPEGIADGPQIEANLDSLINNFKTSFGTDFKIHRIIMPADAFGHFPNENGPCSDKGKGCYYTYTNAVFINELVLVPTYFGGEGTDRQALNRWKELMPGYKIVGIDCSEIIKEYGALHCVTKEIGVREPLRIVHEKLDTICESDSLIRFETTIQHLSGIESANVFYSVGGDKVFQEIPMENIGFELWSASVPNFPKGTKLTYFIRASAESGKTVSRPMPAEKGGWTVTIGCKTSSVLNDESFESVIETFPNPVEDVLSVNAKAAWLKNGCEMILFNSLGEKLLNEEVSFPFELQLSEQSEGIYFLMVEKDGRRFIQKIIKK